MRTFCVEDGPGVIVDEDGCCVHCGNGAVGPWAEWACKCVEALAAVKELRQKRNRSYGRKRAGARRP